MKTSNLLLILILLNTTLLFSETIAHSIEDLSPWLFVALEILLIAGYFFIKTIKAIRKTIDFDFNYLKFMITNSKKRKTSA